MTDANTGHSRFARAEPARATTTPGTSCSSVIATISAAWSRRGSIAGWPLASIRRTSSRRPWPTRPGGWTTICKTRRCRSSAGCGCSPASTSATPTGSTCSHSGAASPAKAGVPEFTDESAVDLVRQLMAHDTSPSNRLVRQERCEQVKEALATLSPQDREVLAMQYVERLSTAEMAEALGMSEPGVKARHLRAVAPPEGPAGGRHYDRP